MAVNIYELQVALSKTAQTAIDVASNDLIRLNTISEDIADIEPVVEDDSDEIGRGNEFPETTYLTSWKCTKKLGFYLSAESLALAAAFGLGTNTAGVYTPIDPVNDLNGIELPWMTIVEGIRKGGARQVLNRALLGCVCNMFTVTLAKGAGRANSKLDMEMVGTGKFIDNTSLAIPPKTVAHLLPAASLTCTINGTDYVAARSFESLSWKWENQPREGYYPGSGFQVPGDPTSGQVQGRMEFGKRQLAVTMISRFDQGSTELAKLEAQTQGTAVLGLSGGAGFETTITHSQVRFKSAKVANEQGIVTVSTEIAALYDATVAGLGSVVSMQVNNTLGTVGRV